ncbi:thioesterase domain-containing protein [Sphaerisporangium sp. TRM90804]|nr:thioesterase domain-containing protein [Sphaerisporangium sp. TRM90804]
MDRPRPSTLESAPTLFCLPYAGGAASAYRPLRAVLGDAAEVVPIQLPGRETRFSEPPHLSVGEITDELAPHTRGPYALYGHSMGARIAFEVVRELRRRALPPPARLYVGGAHPPDRRVPLAAAVDLPDDTFIEQLISRAGALPELRDEPELRELLLPVLRADFTWIRRYRYTPEPPLDVPVVAVAGLDDAEVPPPVMLGWGRHTSSRFRLRTVRGGHLFLADPDAGLARLLADDLADGHAPERVGDDEVHVWLATGDVPAARLADAVMRRYDSAGPAPSCGVAGGDGLALAAVSPGGEIGVAVERLRALDGGHPDDALLSADELEQIEGAAEEDRPWLALRARTAKKALVAASGVEPSSVGFPDLAAPGTWRPVAHGDPGPPPAPPGRATALATATAPGIATATATDIAGWHVTHLPLPTSRGEALAAVALPRGRTLLRFDTLDSSL